jgi:hypothetical protein
MATTNPVFNVLATAGNQAPLAAGNGLSSLANGQIGVFNLHTGLSIDGTVNGNEQDIFLAVGINRTSGGTAAAEDISKSAGQVIQIRNMRAYTIKANVDEIQQIDYITGFGAKCDTDYAVKVTYSSIPNYMLNGYNANSKTYNYHTGCCSQVDCSTCETGDPVELAVGLKDNINADLEAIFVATLFANLLQATIGDPTVDGTAVIGVGTELFNVPLLAADSATQAAVKIAAAINSVSTSKYVATNTGATLKVSPKASVAAPTALITLSSAGGTGVTVGSATNTNVAITDTDAFKASYPGAAPSIKLTTNAQTRTNGNNSINVKYAKAIVGFTTSLIDGFECNGTATTVTQPQAVEGSGYDLKQLEYFAQGWGVPGPYRTNAITGLPNSAESFITESAKYTQISLAYDQFSVGGWLEYLNNLETIIAIPCADSTTLTGLVTILDAIFTQFNPQSTTVSGIDCTNTNINTINNMALDGIESLA